MEILSCSGVFNRITSSCESGRKGENRIPFQMNLEIPTTMHGKTPDFLETTTTTTAKK